MLEKEHNNISRMRNNSKLTCCIYILFSLFEFLLVPFNAQVDIVTAFWFIFFFNFFVTLI